MLPARPLASHTSATADGESLEVALRVLEAQVDAGHRMAAAVTTLQDAVAWESSAAKTFRLSAERMRQGVTAAAHVIDGLAAEVRRLRAQGIALRGEWTP